MIITFYQLDFILKVMMDLKTHFFINEHFIIQDKKGKGTYYIISWKSKGVPNSKLKSLYTAFVNSIKFSKYKI